FTMPSSVIGRRISGSLTPASAAVTCSVVGGETAGGAAILPLLCARGGRRLRGQPGDRHPGRGQGGVEPAPPPRAHDPGPPPPRRPCSTRGPPPARATGPPRVSFGGPGPVPPPPTGQPRQRLLARPGHQVGGPRRVPPEVPGRKWRVPPGHGQPDHPRAPGRLRDQGGRRETTQHAPFVQRLFEPGAEREAGQVAHAEPAGIVRVVARGERAARHRPPLVPDHQHLPPPPPPL